MREIDTRQVTELVEKLCIEANTILPADIKALLESRVQSEINETAKSALEDIIENFRIAEELGLPICQDTGLAVVFADVGQDIHFTGGLFEDAVNEGVRRGYVQGLMRLSVVGDPIKRKNTGDNTPAVIHTRLVAGDRLHLIVAPKGFGSENMSSVRMFLPSSTREDIEDFLVEAVKIAGARPCPPIILGVGLGGTLEQAALTAKKALLRPVSERNPDPFYAGMEMSVLEKINNLGIGVQGFGGINTALAVNIDTIPTHIAGLPCVVNIGCHATRHAEGFI